MTFERANIRAMKGYIPGEQPGSADIIKLNTNENPFPPGPAVEKALSGLNGSDLRRYPQPTAVSLRVDIANLHNLSPENVLATNGGDELLRLVIATFVELDESIGVAAPSYSLYSVLAAAHGCGYREYSLTSDWELPENFAGQLNKDGIKLCFVVNPNAPSGHLLSVNTLKKLATDFKGLLVIDEAYVDFVDPELEYNAVSLVNEFSNVVILRSFSKGYSLAGLRVGYGLASPELIEPMMYKSRDSYNLDYISQVLAQAAIGDQTYARETWNYVRRQRLWLKTALEGLGMTCPESQSNFLLADIPAARSARTLYEALKQQGILVRHFSLPGLENRLRITIGTESENQKLIQLLSGLMA